MSAVIIGIEGTMLLAQEAALLHRPFCAGVILFSRNYSSPAQLKRLCATIRAQRPDALICVDHEGGRVQRFRDGFTAIPAMGAFGRCFDRRPLLACELAEAAGVVIAYELRQFGIDFSFTPVLDLQDPASGVIGDRAFHANPAVVVLLADALRRGLRTAGMIAVGKHYPGHGRVVGDSHHTLPQDPRDADEREPDRYPFIRQIESGIEALMPAHIVFPQTDHRPASFSPVHLAGLRAGELAIRGVADKTETGRKAGETLYDLIKEAYQSGVVIKASKYVVQRWGDNLIAEVSEVVSGGYIVGEIMNSNNKTLSY